MTAGGAVGLCGATRTSCAAIDRTTAASTPTSTMHFRSMPLGGAARRAFAVTLVAGTATACADGATAPAGTRTFESNFATGAQGWTAGFADLPVERDSDWQLLGEVRALPATILGGRQAMYLRGNNHSDDLFSFIVRETPGLAPSTTYRVRFRLEVATRAPAGCVGIGGAPGEAQYVKAGVAGTPVTTVARDGQYVLTADKGNQAVGGAQALLLGNLGTTASACDAPVWAAKALDSGAEAIEVTSDATGRVWLFAGVDSGFEGTTELYVTGFRATFEPTR